MNQTKKRNIIIGALCGVLLLMVVGYAAFSSVLNITGTSKISSNWDIKITDIQTKNVVGGATNAEDPTGIGTLNAAFKTNLVSPGDSIEYHITIKNGGTLNAKLDKITLSEPNNDIITFTASGLTEGEGLDAGVSKVLTVKVEYKDIPEGQEQPSSTTGTLTVKLDFSQGEGGGTVSPGGETAASKLIETAVTSGDGLYTDEYESGRYIYKGTNPNNYITFNNEPWRILSVENDGALKIMKKDSIGNKIFDSKGYRDSTSNGAGGTYCEQSSYGCNVWAVNDNFVNNTLSGTVLKDAEINTYLNVEYYNSLSSEAKNLIQDHHFSVGDVAASNTDLAGQITSENGTTWNGKIGLMTLSEFLRANTNKEQCGNLYLNNTNRDTCKTTNYIVPTSVIIWTVSPDSGSYFNVWFTRSDGSVHFTSAYFSRGVLPTLYLSPEIQLEGDGTYSNPYTIVSK